jgi:hypothetical protein
MLLGDSDGVQKSIGRYRASIIDHKNFEDYLGRYSGLILYLKEMDESAYGKLCGVRHPPHHLFYALRSSRRPTSPLQVNSTTRRCRPF